MQTVYLIGHPSEAVGKRGKSSMGTLRGRLQIGQLRLHPAGAPLRSRMEHASAHHSLCYPGRQAGV